MEREALLERLGYSDSPNFLQRGAKALRSDPDFGHIFRQAEGKNCRLQGVYTLRSPDWGGRVVPTVYVCEAFTEEKADQLHRLVWNQDVVPFLIVHTRGGVKLYSGFNYRSTGGTSSGVLIELTRFNRISSLIEEFHASRIDAGDIWRKWGTKVAPEKRVYWRLLDGLKKLDKWLYENRLSAKETRHALIGKYVYLHYLRDRGILSERKLDTWGIAGAQVFGRNATRAGLRSVDQRLTRWLNGGVFPLRLSGEDAPTDDHVGRVAATFAGDEPVGDSSWQLHLEFKAYDFSYIPIETLSTIYEQFLHAPAKDEDASDSIEGDSEGEGLEPDDSLEGKPSPKRTKGRRTGAYYTPIPVVNLMLAELEERHPIRRGIRVLDPSCGSGAFLVQCYRRLIEREFPPGAKPAPHQLKALLQQSIYGVDVNEDACSVTELSLIMTLLDYVTPPDLEKNPRFELPNLRNVNIFNANFFPRRKERVSVFDLLGGRRFDWVVGNPPWNRLSSNNLDEAEKPAWQWMKDHSSDLPVGGQQIAQAFAWECMRYLKEVGECALLLPAMCLFEDRSRRFRASFFLNNRVHTVVNFSNMAEVLFAGRSRVPAAALFFRPRVTDQAIDDDEFVTTYSPMVANQEATRPTEEGVRNESWTITINGGELREVPVMELLEGSGLPWKLAAWGSAWDKRLLSRVARKWPSLGDLEASWDDKRNEFSGDDEACLFGLSEGPGLRAYHVPTGSEANEYIADLSGKRSLNVSALQGMRDVFQFPPQSLSENTKCYVRRGGAALVVCEPPHVIVSAARNFAVYSDEFLIMQNRQIGIIRMDKNKQFLKAFALFLSSDFVFYHQFFTSTQFGVQRGRATLKALRAIPIPLVNATASELKPWVDLHKRLVKLKPRRLRTPMKPSVQPKFQFAEGEELNRGAEAEREAQAIRGPLLRELNQLASDSLGLTERERALVSDFVEVRLVLNDGKLGQAAVGPPSPAEISVYCRRLKRELDDFVEGSVERRHSVAALHDEVSGMIEVDFTKDTEGARKVRVLAATHAEAKALEQARRHLQRGQSQWVYFNRNLRIFRGRKTFLFKPMQRLHWTESQAMVDAAGIIAETLHSKPEAE